MDHGTSSKVLTAKLASWCHQERLSATDMLDASSEVTKGKVATVDGQQAVPIVLTKKGEDSNRDDMQDLVDADFGVPVGAKAPSGAVIEVPAV